MKCDILLGLQWGDEGKGKVVDVMTPRYDVIARFQGGPNAGHSLEFNGIKHVLHIIPSGIFHKDKTNIIGNGVVIDPCIFEEEINALVKMGLDPVSNLLISKKAHLILPTHRLLDAAQEAQKGKNKIGSTLKGIGPTYTDKTARHGLRVIDILSPDFTAKYNTLTALHKKMLKMYEFEVVVIGLGSQSDFLDDNLGRFLLDFFLFFLLLIEEFLVIHDFAYRRIGLGGDFHQIQFKLVGHIQSLFERDNLRLEVFTYNTHDGRSDVLVNAVRSFLFLIVVGKRTTWTGFCNLRCDKLFSFLLVNNFSIKKLGAKIHIFSMRNTQC